MLTAWAALAHNYQQGNKWFKYRNATTFKHKYFSKVLTFMSSCSLVVSLSTAKSQIAIWLSSPPEAKTELSSGLHSTVVIALVWCLKTANSLPF